MEKLNLYTLDINKRYEFMATAGERVVDEIYPKHSGMRTPDYWNKERIILNDVKIFNGSQYVDFEPTIKMDLGKQFKTTNEYDIITFDAGISTINCYYGNYDSDDRGLFKLTIDTRNWWDKEELYGTKTKLKDYIESRKDFADDDEYYDIECYEVRRLIRPTKLEIILKAPDENIA